jgi:hypothetical protein
LGKLRAGAVENKARERRHLAQANRQIAELEIRIRRQRAVIKRLIAAGRRTELDAPRVSTSSSTEESLGFWVDDAAKTVALADGTSLTVHRFDDHWISATRGDMSYEFDRQNGNLAYASSTTKDGAATIIIGSGRCEIAGSPAG